MSSSSAEPLRFHLHREPVAALLQAGGEAACLRKLVGEEVAARVDFSPVEVGIGRLWVQLRVSQADELFRHAIFPMFSYFPETVLDEFEEE